MNDKERIIADARQTLQQSRRRELKEAASIVDGWQLLEVEPPKPAQKLDTQPDVISAAQLEERLRQERVACFDVVGEAVDAMERALDFLDRKIAKQQAELSRLEVEMAKSEARLCHRIANLDLLKGPLDCPNPLSRDRAN